jgi:hypothetical protein
MKTINEGQNLHFQLIFNCSTILKSINSYKFKIEIDSSINPWSVQCGQIEKGLSQIAWDLKNCFRSMRPKTNIKYFAICTLLLKILHFV